MGMNTVSSASLDPLAFHLMLVLIAAAAGFYVSKFTGIWTEAAFSRSFKVPDMAAAMICGLVLKKLLNLLDMGDAYIDRQVMTRIGSTATDWLVGFGMASIQIAVVFTYIKPIIFMCLAGYGMTLAYLFVLAPRMNPAFWFERGIFTFGWSTGVVAMDITLLRVVDPELKSGTLEDYGLAYILISPVELLLIAFLPMLIGMGYIWSTIVVLLVLFLLILLLSKFLGFWSGSYPFYGPREAERDVMGVQR
jgi:ESS family glutamate:Na+ symporter